MEFVDVKCPLGSDICGFDEKVVEQVGLEFPQAYTYAEGIAKIAAVVREQEHGAVCMIPFCHTVEAENYGGDIELGNARIGPRCNMPIYSSAEDLLRLPELDFGKGRLGEVIKSISILKAKGESVGVEICGPITTLNNLIDIAKLFKIWRKEPEIITVTMEKMRLELLKYIEKALDAGVDFIAFEDPVGGFNILGPKYFEQQGRNFSYPFVQAALKLIDGRCVMHLCPKTTSQLVSLGFAQWDEFDLPEEMTYAKVCLELRGKIKLVGNICIHNRNRLLANKKMKSLKLL
ncbi:uroporphyrinogen decarboxylase family protein [Sporomusa sp. KB1]|jgi:uroporphyrinogen-III decarboxylase|uniref:uroporphyrinogen decarboxylase family protein n=1 Tax=Sporomusa sp. KB1 TaxID=943346 RepID=UPI0011A46A72|nr:uroporphyrinogen decarboxylase family protein [Sporomusa sp. KB1]TWH49366.1 uroporphyrinogen-III decarboxylase [Sporomusa sp. KB1]